MCAKPNYNDRKLVNSACESILKVIQPGDVVNQFGDFKWWEFWMALGSCAIQRFQKKLFGKNSYYKDDHTMMFLNEFSTFSVQPLKATMKPLQVYCLSDLSIYRFRLKKLTKEDINTMLDAAREILGTDYDYGQLLDIAINDILGYKHQRRLRIFDLGRKKKVCSVGVRLLYEYLYNTKIKTKDAKPRKWLFAELNPEKWTQKEIEKYRGTDVEATSPGHFANSDYFCHEFELIARFSNGKQVIT